MILQSTECHSSDVNVSVTAVVGSTDHFTKAGAWRCTVQCPTNSIDVMASQIKLPLQTSISNQLFWISWGTLRGFCKFLRLWYTHKKSQTCPKLMFSYGSYGNVGLMKVAAPTCVFCSLTSHVLLSTNIFLFCLLYSFSSHADGSVRFWDASQGMVPEKWKIFSRRDGMDMLIPNP